MTFVKPMKAKKDNTEGIPGRGYGYEVKYDGIRACFVWSYAKGLTIYSKSGTDITRKFPEIVEKAPVFIARKSMTFDGELVCFKNGVPDFSAITSRFHLNSPEGWDRGRKENPVTAMLFDVLTIDDRDVMGYGLMLRRQELGAAISTGDHFQISKMYDDGSMLYNREKVKGAEGIMAKRKLSTYQPGRRLKDWLKVKIMYEEVVEVYGFIWGKGKRDSGFGSLLFRGLDGRPAGKVGTGFTDAEWADMNEFLDTRDPVFQIDGKAVETFLIDKPFKVKVKGMKKNKSGAIREPVFIGTVE